MYQQGNRRLQEVALYQRCVVTFSITSICLSCASLVVVGLVIYKRGGLPFSKSTNQQKYPIACISSVELMPSPYGARDPLLSKLTLVKDENGNKTYCAHNSEQITALLQLSMRRPNLGQENLPEFNASNFTFSPASAHKQLLPIEIFNADIPIFESTGNIPTKLYLHNEMNEHSRRVKILSEGLQISQPGLYFVYSNIQFMPDSAHPCKDFKYQTWSHLIESKSKSRMKSETLLKTVHTCCDTCTGDEETSFTSGIFRLSKGDIIHVLVSGHGLVYFKETTSYIGLMMLENGNTH